MWSSLTGSSHLARSHSGVQAVVCVAGPHPFSCLSDVQLCVRTAFYSISWLMDIWVVSACQLLWAFPAQVSVWTYVFTSLWFKPGSWIAGSHHNATFNAFMGLPNCFQSSCDGFILIRNACGY